MLLPLSSGGDGIYNLHDPVQGRVSTNGHISATEVIVDGANQPHDVQVAGLCRLLGCDLPCEGSKVEASR